MQAMQPYKKMNMKKAKLCLLFLVVNIICFAGIHAKFQIGQNKSNYLLNENHDDSIALHKEYDPIIIKISPFQIIFGDFITNSFSAGLSFEKPIKNTYSLHIGARYIFTDKSDVFDKRWIVINVEQVNGFAIETEFRKFITKGKVKMSGAYLSANSKSIFTQVKYRGGIVNRFSSGFYINIGWQEIFDSGTVFDIAVGVGLKYVASNTKSSVIFYGETHHIMDGGKKPYHTGSALFPFVNINFNLGWMSINN